MVHVLQGVLEIHLLRGTALGHGGAPQQAASHAGGPSGSLCENPAATHRHHVIIHTACRHGLTDCLCSAVYTGAVRTATACEAGNGAKAMDVEGPLCSPVQALRGQLCARWSGFRAAQRPQMPGPGHCPLGPGPTPAAAGSASLHALHRPPTCQAWLHQGTCTPLLMGTAAGTLPSECRPLQGGHCLLGSSAAHHTVA